MALINRKYMKKPLFNKVCIVGVGLIGGSLGMAIKKRHLAQWVVGVARKKATLKEAFRKKAIDIGTLDLAKGVEGADLVILCMPVTQIIHQMKVLPKFLKRDALVIDVGSSKVLIEQAARRFLKGNAFVGCHPMAGSSRRGINSADAQASLFEQAQCFVALPHAKIIRFWKSLGATPIVLPAHKHDEWVAGVSYMTHLTAFALLGNEAMSKLVRFGINPLNPSFRDVSRLSKSDPVLWADIFDSNKYTLTHIKAFKRYLVLLEKALASKNRRALVSLIAHANQISNRFLPYEKNSDGENG
jgi:prephenate dehydrogenase